MKAMTTIVSLAAGALLATASLAQAPAGAPAGATGQCNDGSYWTGASKSGACSGHKGVKQWYGAATAAATSAPKPTAAPASVAPTAKAAAGTTAAPATAAPGGGAGLVWVTPSSKTYHCPNDKWYGKTKGGKYEPEQQAVASGYHPDHGKACHA